ncbi:mediator complex, subunit Med11 [Rhodotorula toruloides]|uniref:Mediator of RNA polymerase II transcription subunit 11 n=1 Tax=Rhodotorula toruloides TaxID=5286 RepID=A0A511KIR5_RHOTO|nr:mediator complex, subunit Med11 [Rhodotorula toruloides]
MDVDQQSHTGSENGGEEEAWRKTRAGKRIEELKVVEENIAALLHFAGCTLASLHPDPLSSFTSRELATDDEGDDGTEAGGAASGEGGEKLAEFSKYAEGYYATLNDIQLALRTSIRHLRVSRTSAAPLIDPSFGSLVAAGTAASAVGPGGVAFAELLKPLEGQVPLRDGNTQRVRETAGEVQAEERLSAAALELEREAWADLVRSIESGRAE